LLNKTLIGESNIAVIWLNDPSTMFILMPKMIKQIFSKL